MTMRRLALFDLDHTLLPHDTMFLFANFVLRKHPLRLAYLFVFAPFVFMRIIGVIDEVPLKRAFFSFLWRMRKSEVDRLAQEFVCTDVVPLIYPELRTVLERERKNGNELILNTASPEFFVQYIARALNFDHWFATPMPLPDANTERMPLLPRFTGPNNKGEEKIARMHAAGLLTPADELETLRRTRGNPEAADPRVALAATDSTADLPMLRLAERGLLVHPDAGKFERKTGRKIEQFSDWTIQEPARPYSGRRGERLVAILQMLGLYRVFPDMS